MNDYNQWPVTVDQAACGVRKVVRGRESRKKAEPTTRHRRAISVMIRPALGA